MTDSLRRVARGGMMATPPAKVGIRLALVEAERSGVLACEREVRAIVGNLRRLEVRQHLRVADRDAFDDPDQLLGIAWMRAGHRVRREIRSSLESKPDGVLSITAMRGPSGFLLEFAVVHVDAPHSISEQLVSAAALAWLPVKGHA